MPIGTIEQDITKTDRALLITVAGRAQPNECRRFSGKSLGTAKNDRWEERDGESVDHWRGRFYLP